MSSVLSENYTGPNEHNTEDLVLELTREYENKLKAQKLEILAQIKETKKYKKLYESTRNEVKQLKQKQYEYNIDREAKAKYISSLESDLEIIREEKARLESTTSKQINRLEKSLNNVIKSNKLHKEKVSHLKTSKALLLGKLIHYKELTKNYSIGRVNKERKRHRQIVDKLAFKIAQRENEVSVLKNKLGSISSEHIKDTSSSVQFEESIGYIQGRKFISNDKEFRLINIHEGGVYKSYTVGDIALPVKEFYKTSIQHLTKSKKRLENNSSEPLDILEFESYKVLIIGERNKDLYTSRLAKCGLQVDMISSYENNVVRIKNKFNQYDIVICLLDHARHYAVNLMNHMQKVDSNNKYKYTVVKDDKLDKLISHINFVIENLNNIERERVSNE